MTTETRTGLRPTGWITIGSVALVMVVIAAVVVAPFRGADRPGRDGVLEIVVEDFTLTPARFVVPAGEPVTLVFVSRNEYTQNLTFGRAPIVEAGRTTGFGEDLLAMADATVTPRSAWIGPSPNVDAITLSIKPGTTVTVQLTLPSEAVGTWQVGCYIGVGCDFRVGPTAELTVE